ncbi:uncharacterized protein LOC143426300 [Xylocopa sonorina]|uniref:uncharacterized protein LOC143426300 n=1 Tax=Xylocopa sonorina TaxID=1818115 RepID=UPI00403A9147
MALSFVCRLKISSLVSVNGATRSPLIKPNIEVSFPTSESIITLLDEKNRNTNVDYRCRSLNNWPKNISTYELSRTRLPTVNGEKSIYCWTASNKRIGQRIFLFDCGSSILSQFLAPIDRSWKFSKRLCPSTGYHSSSTKKLSNWLLKFYSSTDNPSCCKFSCEKLQWTTDLYQKKFGLNIIRNYSSYKGSPNDKTSKSGECIEETLKTTTVKQEVPKDCCSKFDEKEEVCSASERTCPPVFQEVPPVCRPAPCPDVEDYCPSKSTYEEKFWRLLSFLSIPVIILMSGYVYSRQLEKQNEPRPEFVDVPYLRRIVKPFPWGDGRHTLFHNPKKNPISPHGYEVEDRNATNKGERKD